MRGSLRKILFKIKRTKSARRKQLFLPAKMKMQKLGLQQPLCNHKATNMVANADLLPRVE